MKFFAKGYRLLRGLAWILIDSPNECALGTFRTCFNARCKLISSGTGCCFLRTSTVTRNWEHLSYSIYKRHQNRRSYISQYNSVLRQKNRLTTEPHFWYTFRSHLLFFPAIEIDYMLPLLSALQCRRCFSAWGDEDVTKVAKNKMVPRLWDGLRVSWFDTEKGSVRFSLLLTPTPLPNDPIYMKYIFQNPALWVCFEYN